VAYDDLDKVDHTRGRGRLVALDATTGKRVWERRFRSPDFGCATVADDVVFTSTYDGTVYALAAESGRVLWHYRMRAGINACPAVAGDLLLVGAGAGRGRGERVVRELVAFELP
jgi:outer membrane protein assembly factor BamB